MVIHIGGFDKDITTFFFIFVPPVYAVCYNSVDSGKHKKKSKRKKRSERVDDGERSRNLDYGSY
jgi:hypothetical protein